MSQGIDREPLPSTVDILLPVHFFSMVHLRRLVWALFCCVVGRSVAAARAAKGNTPTEPLPVPHHDMNPLKIFATTIRNARHHLAAAATARCVSIFGMYPVDAIKVRAAGRGWSTHRESIFVVSHLNTIIN